MAGPFDLTGQDIENTYQRVLQTDGTDIYDGTGSLFTISGNIDTGSFVTTSSFNLYTGSNTSQFAGTASYALTASYVLNAVSSSFASTASYAANGGVTKIIAGGGITISPSLGLGDVTINSTATTYNTATGSYGSFYNTGSQTAISATAIYSMSLSTTDISNGVFVSGSDKTRVYVTNAGVYNFQFSAQFRNTDTSDEQHVAVWVRKNNISSANDIVDSNSFISVSKAKGGNPGETIAAWNFFLQLAAGDFIQLLWHAETANKITLETIPAGVSPTHPRTPSLILTANRVDTFLSNTGSFSGSFTGNFTGSLLGTASYATQALSASYAPDTTFPYTGSALITGSLGIIGSFNQGIEAYATGDYSHAEGNNTSAIGVGSHAEGYFSSAYGNYSHAEGTSTTNGTGSHAEGNDTIANGDYSHAEGLGTIASGSYQHVQGQYNQSSSAQSAFIVGNGTSDGARSNLIFASGSQVQVTGSVIATAGFTGSLLGTATTASYVLNAISSSFALTASFINIIDGGTF